MEKISPHKLIFGSETKAAVLKTKHNLRVRLKNTVSTRKGMAQGKTTEGEE